MIFAQEFHPNRSKSPKEPLLQRHLWSCHHFGRAAFRRVVGRSRRPFHAWHGAGALGVALNHPFWGPPFKIF